MSYFSNLAAVSQVLSNIFYIFVAIMVLLLMITIHEFGHYIAGKKLGFKINEFAIGFGKKLYSRTLKNGEEFSLRLFPLGGYCAFEGEDKDSNSPLAFNNQKPWKRLIVLVAGVTFNFISAIIFSVILLTAYGYDIPKVMSVEQLSPNATVIEVDNVWYGLQADDIIWKVNGEDINFANNHTLDYLLSQYEAGQPITLTIERNGEKMETVVELYEVTQNDVTQQKLGIGIRPYAFPFFQALVRSVPFTIGMAWKILSFLWLLIIGKIGLSGVGGPITTITTIASYTQASFAGFLVLLPLIAVNLAVFNLIPFPALDGSRMVFVAIEWIRGKPINPKVEGMIHFIGLMLLLSLVFIADLFQLIT